MEGQEWLRGGGIEGKLNVKGLFGKNGRWADHAIPPYKVILFNRLEREGKGHFVWGNGTVNPPSVPAKQALRGKCERRG